MPAVRSRIRKGDRVRVIAGKHKGEEGEVLSVLRDKGRVLVKNVNIIKKARKPTQDNPRGGFVEQEASIHISNVQLVDPQENRTTRIGVRVKYDVTKLRVSKRIGAEMY